MDTSILDKRQIITNRIKEDLIGPLQKEEVLTESPTDAYLVGTLFPGNLFIEEDENDNSKPESFDADTKDEDSKSLSPTKTSRPSSIGVSFIIKEKDEIEFVLNCGVYTFFEEEIKEQKKKKRKFWKRQEITHTQILRLNKKQDYINLNHENDRINNLRIWYTKKQIDNLNYITLILLNSNTFNKDQDTGVDLGEKSFFQVNFYVKTQDEFYPKNPIDKEQEDDEKVYSLIYRNNQDYATGYNCSAQWDLNNEKKVNLISTEWINEQKSYNVSSQGDESYFNEGNEFTTENFITKNKKETIAILSKLTNAYKNWISDLNNEKNYNNFLREQVKKNISNCEVALKRISQGIALLKNNDQSFLAFQLANKAIQKQFYWKNKDTKFIWRPFQVAFFLLNLESISNEQSKDRNIFDLLWFPTGGGKTEAYLFLSAYLLFYSRLKKFSNTSSVQIMMRYTLRVLTIDQFTRISALISACEIIRKENEDKLGDDQISLGLWVGQSQTENYFENIIDNPNHSRPLTKCPCCDNNLDYSEINVEKKEILIKCVNPNKECEIKISLACLPVFFIDELIYKSKPSFLISTIDKFAQIARKDEALNLFSSESKVSLIIQDELHLIAGPLGTISGLYETAIDELTSQNGFGAKMIGSTATIKSASKQILNLYNRESFQFPPPGLNADNSFFAKEDKNSFRIYIGISSIGRTEKYMLQAITASLLQSIKDKQIIEDENFKNSYSTIVAYFNSLKILSGATAMMDEQVRDTIDAIAVKRIEQTRSENLNSPEELSGRKISSEIPIIRDNLINRKPGDADFIDILLATNMISVGLDIGRLNLMIVNGQPKTMSEYIQASSRVGRSKNSGIIVSLYNHSKVRDRNRFESFKHWHGEIYKGVENTSVTPFASRSRDKALHVLLVILAKGLLKINDPSTIGKYKKKIIELIFPIILKKVESLDPMELKDTKKELNKFLDYWEERALQGNLKYFWHKKITQSLLMSLEDFAAKKQYDQNFNSEEIVAWPTPNSMRDVEPGVQFLCKDYPIPAKKNVE